MKRYRVLVCAVLFAFAACGLAWRVFSAPAVQAQQPDQATIKAEARLVLVDTVVTDKHGNYIRDLTQKDFKVWEDNKEQAIKSFSFESGSSPSANPQRHYLVLFFDDSSMEVGDQANARQAAAKFIDHNAGPNRVMAVIEFGGTLRITQNFTADADRLKQAVAGVKGSAVASNPSATDSTLGSIPNPQTGTQVASLGTPSLGMPSLGNAETDFGARTVLLALRQLAKNLQSVPGRKTLVMLTSGFPLTTELQSELAATIDACNKSNVAVYPIDVRGLVAPGFQGAARPAAPPWHSAPLLMPTYAYFEDKTTEPELVFVQHGGAPGGSGGAPGGAGGGSHGGTPGGTGAGSPGGSGGSHGSPGAGTGSSHAGSPSTGTAGRPAGAPPGTISNYYNPNYQPREIIPPFPPSSTVNQQVLYSLADGTGGFVILNTNDLLGGMEKIAKEQDEYYLLGYTPTDTPEGSCHVLRVKVDRGDTVVRARSGYCNVKPADMLAAKPIEKQMESQANGSQSGTFGAGAAIQTPYFYTSANTARVNLAMEIPAGSIKFEKVKGKQHATLNILGIAYKADSSVAARFSDAVEIELDGKKEVEEFAQQPYHYENQFEVAAGQYNLKVVFNSGGEAFGKIETPLVVDPYDGTRFGLSSMALSKDLRRAADMSTGLDAALMEDHAPLIARGMQIVPAANYRFKKNDTAAMYAEIYEPLLASPSPPQVQLQMKVLDRKTGQAKIDSGMLATAAFIQKGNPVIPVGLKLPVNMLDPGSYRVELVALDSAGNRSTKRTADFEVE
ncbi:MAG TPA: VWA domain-containing protein [Terriglobales bacterium]|nr:VWA domain-containing protein [Terriglobales bacterium]